MWMLHFASESSSCSHGYVFQSCAYISWISSNSSQYLHDIFWNWKDVIFKLCNLLIDLTPSQLYYIEFALFVQKLNKKALISFHNGAYDHSKKWLPINKTIPVIISTVTVLLSCCLQVGSMGSRRVLCLFLIWLLAGWKCSVEATDCVLSLHCPWQHNMSPTSHWWVHQFCKLLEVNPRSPFCGGPKTIFLDHTRDQQQLSYYLTNKKRNWPLHWKTSPIRPKAKVVIPVLNCRTWRLGKSPPPQSPPSSIMLSTVSFVLICSLDKMNITACYNATTPWMLLEGICEVALICIYKKWK